MQRTNSDRKNEFWVSVVLYSWIEQAARLRRQNSNHKSNLTKECFTLATKTASISHFRKKQPSQWTFCRRCVTRQWMRNIRFYFQHVIHNLHNFKRFMCFCIECHYFRDFVVSSWNTKRSVSSRIKSKIWPADNFSDYSFSYLLCADIIPHGRLVHM